MINLSSISLSPCKDSKYIKIYEMSYIENETKKRWEVVHSNDAVMILIYNTDNKSLISVKQFRPAVYLRNNDGYMNELCAGLVDKEGKSISEIAAEEIEEECGYKVESNSLEKIAEFYSSVGTSGSKQYLFYAEVSNKDKISLGGGIDDEFIEVIETPLEHIMNFLTKPNITPSLAFAFMWFKNNKKVV